MRQRPSATSVFCFIISFLRLNCYIEILSDPWFALLHTGTSNYLLVQICEGTTIVSHVLLSMLQTLGI
jgi:hypothetical protein